MTFTPSASALKFVMTRWRRTDGRDGADVLAAGGTRLPLRTARVFAPRIRYCEARGPAPQLTQSCTNCRVGRLGPASRARPHRVGDDVLGDRDAADRLLDPQDVRAASGPSSTALSAARRSSGDDLLLFLLVRVVDRDVEHEPVELRLGQRVGPFQLDRVLRRQDEERRLEGEGLRPPAVTCFSCIAWSSAACVLGGVRLISSARIRLAKIGPADELERAPCPVVRSSSRISVPVMSDGIRSGVNWMRLNLRSSTWASVEIRRVLASPGTPTRRQCPSAKRAPEQLVDDPSAGRRSPCGPRRGSARAPPRTPGRRLCSPWGSA